MRMSVHAGLLLLPCVHALAAPREGGLLIEPARRARVASLSITIMAGCGNLRLMPMPGEEAGAARVHDAGFRLEPARPLGRATAIPGDLSRQIDAAAAAYGHEVALVKAIVRVESAFDATAVSPKGALGLMQIMPATATGLGVADPARDLLDPETNLRAGARHLRVLRNKFPDRLDLVIAAYNAGEGAVARWAGIPPYAETRAYVESVLAWHARYQQGQGADAALPTAAPRTLGCGP